MTERGVDILDRIDALVDEQLANYENRSGYDHDVNQEQCRCGRDWHGLPITERIEDMRSFGDFDPGYVYAEDDSPVLCVGSDTPGPWRVVPLGAWNSLYFARMMENSYQAAARHVQRLIDRIESDYQVPQRFGIVDGWPYMPTSDFARGERVGWDNGDGIVHVGTVEAHEPDGHGGWTITIGDDTSPAPDTRIPQQRALPRPSTTPPMWAHNPNRSRRPRRNRNQPTRQVAV